MWTPNEAQYEQLKKMPSGQRLFVQRWIESLALNTNFRWRLRPIPRNLIQREIAEIKIDGSGKRRLNGSTLYADLVDEEWRVIPKTMFRRWEAGNVVARPIDTAEAICHGLSLAGFSHRTLFGARRILLSAADLQEQLDSIQLWHADRTTRRSFHVVVPIIRSGYVPASTGMSVSTLENLRPELKNFVTSNIPADPSISGRKFLVVNVVAVDPTSAVLRFLEHFDRYELRLRRPSRPVLIAHESVLVYDEHPPPDGRLVRFPMPSRFEYAKPDNLSRSVGRFVDVVDADPVVDVILDQYLIAVKAIEEGSIRDAFQAIVPVLDVGFECREGPWSGRTPFARTVELASGLLAVALPGALFRHIHAYLRKTCWLDGGRSALTGDDLDSFQAVTTPRQWGNIESRYGWNELLIHRRKQLVSLLNDPLAHVQRIRKVVRWDIARAVRARHAFAHRGEPMADSYVLAVILEAIHLCLITRCVAAEKGIRFSDLVGHIEKVASAEVGADGLNWTNIAVNGAWSFAD